MRNTSQPARGTWAAYVEATRTMFGLTKTEMARRIGRDRGTIHRWEMGQTKPEDPNVVQRFAAEFDLDIEEALAAAGMRPDMEAPTRPGREPPLTPELLAVLRILADPSTSRADYEYIRRTLISLANLPPEEPGRGLRRTGS